MGVACATLALGSSALQAPVDFLEILLAQRADRRLEPQHANQIIEIRLRKIAPRLKHVLLRIQHIEVRADADLLPESVRFVGDLR